MRNVPEHMSSPARYLFLAFSDLRLLKDQRVQPYSFAVRAPASRSLRGLLGAEGFVYQFAARALALVALLVSVRLPRRRGAAIA